MKPKLMTFVMVIHHKNHIRTCPYVLDSLRELCLQDTAAIAHRDHVTNNPSSTHLAILQP